MGRRLVRSKALDNWAVPGAEHQVRPVVDEYEHQQLLLTKLGEEVLELISSGTTQEFISELADIHHVLDAIVQVFGIDELVLGKELARKGAESGYFNPGLVWDTGR